MDPAKNQRKPSFCNVVAVPYPGRGHVNPMMNLCKLLALKKQDILITFVVTEEWYGLITPHCKSNNIRLSSIPNILPSEHVRGADFPGFYEAVMTRMEAPFDHFLDQLDLPVTVIVTDAELPWAIRTGNKRNIPVAAFSTLSATLFSILHHFCHIRDDQILRNFADRGNKVADQIGGTLSIYAEQLRTTSKEGDEKVTKLLFEAISSVSKAQYLLFSSAYELESEVIDSLREKFSFPVYPIGPAIPYMELNNTSSVPTSPAANPDYLEWLDSQPKSSVLYVALGSFIQVSSNQMDEIAAGLRRSGVRFLWVARGETSQLKELCGDNGMVVPWCEQLKVLSHSSVGGFWTHCGWNSTLESAFSGVPMLTFPLLADQPLNSTQIVEHWRVGWRVRQDKGSEDLVTGNEIAELLQRFMDTKTSEGKELRRRAKEIQELCRQAIAKGGSSDKNLETFITDITKQS